MIDPAPNRTYGPQFELVTPYAAPYAAVRRDQEPEHGSWWTLADLMAAELPEIPSAVKGLLPTGCIVVAAKPKVGKSGWVLTVGLHVASGRTLWGEYETQRGDVLYIPYEDTLQDVKKRARTQLDAMGIQAPDNFQIAEGWPRAENGGVRQLGEILEEFAGELRLVIIDDMRHFSRVGMAYQGDASAIEEVDLLGRKYNVAIVVIMHQGKGNPSNRKNWSRTDRIQGSMGVTAAARSIVTLERDVDAGSPDGLMTVIGKGLPSRNVALRFDEASGIWAVPAAAADIRSDQQEAVWQDVARYPGMTAPQLSRKVKRPYDVLRLVLRRMRQQGAVIEHDHRYYPARPPGSNGDASSGRQEALGDVVAVDGAAVQLDGFDVKPGNYPETPWVERPELDAWVRRQEQR